MNVMDFVILGIIAVILGASIWLLYRSKKSGKKCIGCPDSCACSDRNCSGGCSSCKHT